MTKCQACGKDVLLTKSLSFIPFPELCLDCFDYITTDESNITTSTDPLFKEYLED
jgi:hypothetical protein